MNTPEEARQLLGVLASKYEIEYEDFTPLFDLLKRTTFTGERICENCKFRRTPPKSLGLGKLIPEHRYCMHPKNGSIRDADSKPEIDEAAFFETHYGSGLSDCPEYEFVTGPKFGCIHFEGQ